MTLVSSNDGTQPGATAGVTGRCALRLSGLTKSFGDVAAVADVSLEVPRGEILCLLGPSGCGKTTTLRLVAGFDTPDAGTIHIDERLVAGPGANQAPEKRRVGMVFQEGALFPHLTVAQNVAFGLPRERQRGAKAAQALRLVNLEGYDNRYPHQLSGGQQQRVALARALAPSPDLILMDEPFSSLDAGLRGQLRAEVRSILKEREATVVWVTHDQEEAMQLADRVAVMNEGRLVQLGSPEQVFDHPDTRFAAEFFGTADFLPAWREDDRLACELGRVACPSEWAGLWSRDGGLQVMVRPDCLDIDTDGRGNGVIEGREFLGAFHLYTVRLDSGDRVRVMQSHIRRFNPGMRVEVFLREGHRPLPFANGRSFNGQPQGVH